MTTLALWLLLTVPANPHDTTVLETHRSREACEAIQITEYIAGRVTRCQALVIPALEPDWKGPR
jgi:hypothetical protein